MGYDVCALVRRDHDDIDRAFAAMVDPATPPHELTNLLDIVLLALAVHAAAEAKVFETLLATCTGPRTLSMIATQTRTEHAAQRAATEALTRIRPASIGWYDHTIELRILVLEHATRADQLRYTLLDHVPPTLERSLGCEYATERMHVLASTSPLMFSAERELLRPVS
jgi:hypothetical protein